jgi:transcriptional regulator with GAF, ATPase, and Fis domain
MASLRIQIPGQSAQVYRLYKRITTLGHGSDCDVVLPDPILPDLCAHLLFDGREYSLSVADKAEPVVINGKKRKKHPLVHEDRLVLGEIELVFSLTGEATTEAPPRADVDAYRDLYEFSAKLMENYALPELLNALMDLVIQITHADRGFLILMEGETLDVKVARNLRKENIADAVSQLSDAIIAKVVKLKRPVIISDAMNDAEFASSHSVINLKLSSVMCVPLLERGNVLGLIYVGNDSIANLFEEHTLGVLTVFAAQASLIIRNALLVNDLKLDNRMLHEKLEQRRFGEIIGACPAMQEVYKRVERIAQADIGVLITGETGTGKELIAREIHNRSPRAKGAFVSINCGAIPENLLESELFGHVKGAFTGAVQHKQGKFHVAHGGTLFLDEIGEMPLPLQVKILRALQEKVVVRVGDTRPESVDIRVVAATNRDLESEIKNGRFRDDLYYRLNVVKVHLPPLCERGDDIVILARYLLARYAPEYGGRVKGFTESAVVALRKYRWPGNIRELENRLKRAIVLADKALLAPEDLDLTAEALAPILPLADAKEKFQRDYINEVLALNSGNRTKTARDLGVDPRTIFRHLEKEDGEAGLESPGPKGVPTSDDDGDAPSGL